MLRPQLEDVVTLRTPRALIVPLLMFLKSKGGLGLRDLEEWNKACILQCIRTIRCMFLICGKQLELKAPKKVWEMVLQLCDISRTVGFLNQELNLAISKLRRNSLIVVII
ncbi:hypothetical protein J1N35_022184 [Gossypium stocksii]|uniref:Uncharacterized protein n=1 Tax=Gossypium stocksii TaxID=47602 RepID=A0A9D3VG52_9ROSI|nr:hypothetical protein J1N35_022184 [Gossypium stocksii]